VWSETLSVGGSGGHGTGEDGRVPGLDGLVIATGLGASGLTMGPLAGSLAAQAALSLPPAIDLKPFGPLPGPPGSL
jgi:glycine/D-amino acid oxidase-like deaminating enzyme